VAERADGRGRPPSSSRANPRGPRSLSTGSPSHATVEPGDRVVAVTSPGFEGYLEKRRLSPGEPLNLNLVLRKKIEGVVVALKRPDGGSPPPTGLEREGEMDRRPRRFKRPPAPMERPKPAAFGFLTVSSIPWSRVYLDGTLLGDTPFAKVKVLVGTHALRLVNPERRIEVTRPVTIQPNTVTKLNLLLPQGKPRP
jgi:hypothetical protein